MSKGQFNEPWVSVREAKITHQKDNQWYQTELIIGGNMSPKESRAVACVNALDGLNPEAVPKAVEALKAMLKAHDSIFSQCMSNPVTNAWGKEVDMTLVNEAQVAALNALQQLTGERHFVGLDGQVRSGDKAIKEEIEKCKQPPARQG